MKKLLLVLLALTVLGLPSIAAAQEMAAGTQSAPSNFFNPDIFVERAQTCSFFFAGCGPDNFVDGFAFDAYVRVFYPVSQFYSRFYLITDIERNVVAILGGSSFQFSGDVSDNFVTFSLFPGLYLFQLIVFGDDGRMATSDSYRFRAL
jgi:hypothetical protein